MNKTYLFVLILILLCLNLKVLTKDMTILLIVKDKVSSVFVMFSDKG